MDHLGFFAAASAFLGAVLVTFGWLQLGVFLFVSGGLAAFGWAVWTIFQFVVRKK